MMRRSVLFGFAVSLLVAVGLFQLKYKVADQERMMAKISAEIYETEEAIHILQAEWSYLNEPGRLQLLAGQHLSLSPSETIQLVSYSHIEQLYKSHAGSMNEGILEVRY